LSGVSVFVEGNRVGLQDPLMVMVKVMMVIMVIVKMVVQ